MVHGEAFKLSCQKKSCRQEAAHLHLFTVFCCCVLCADQIVAAPDMMEKGRLSTGFPTETM